VWHRDDDAVSPVIGTILMVAITVVLAAVLWLMVSGMITGPDEEKVTVNLATPDVQQQTRATLTCWDATLNINKMTPKDEKVLWSATKIIVKSSSGSVLTSATTLTADAPATYDADGDADGDIEVQYWYVETTGDTKMSAGDAVKITGMDDATNTAFDWRGATIELTKGGERIASIKLPTNFP
jgi:flagellin-like protein